MSRKYETAFLDGLQVDVYRSEEDGRLVVDITGPAEEADLTDLGEPKVRIWVNEALIYDDGKVGDDLSGGTFPKPLKRDGS
jgi:hypothetical protein